MSHSPTLGQRNTIETEFGPVSYVESGSGPAAVFVHGVFLNANLWDHQLEALGDLRRCIAVDLLAHGTTTVPEPEAMTFRLQAEMILHFLDALELESVDLVANDSGGAIAQIIASLAGQRLRTLTLTNCDTHDNWPPEAFAPIYDLATRGELAATLQQLAADPELARNALASGFERPDRLPDEAISGFFRPFEDPRRSAAVQAFVAGMDNSVTVAIRDDLARLRATTLIVWGVADQFFDVSWARWLASTIPGTVRCVEVEGAKLFFPMERPEVLSAELRSLWATHDRKAPADL